MVFDVLVISLSHECCFKLQKQKISRTKYLTFCQAQESHLNLTLLTTKSKEIFQLQSLCFHQSRPRSSVYWTRQPLLCHWSVPPLYTHIHTILQNYFRLSLATITVCVAVDSAVLAPYQSYTVSSAVHCSVQFAPLNFTLTGVMLLYCSNFTVQLHSIPPYLYTLCKYNEIFHIHLK